MKYFISVAVLLLVIVLFIRTALPRSNALMTLAREVDWKTMFFRLGILSMNSSDCARKGGGLNVRTPIRELRRFYKVMERRIKSGENTENFERIMYACRDRAEESMKLVEKDSALFFRLPHRGKYPRLYELCALLVGSCSGYVSRDTAEKAIAAFNEHSPLEIKEIKALKSVFAFCVIEQLAVLAVKSRAIQKSVLRAEKDAVKQRIDLTSLKYNSYIFAYTERMDGSVARKFSSVCFENGIDVYSRVDEYARKCSRYASVAQGASDSLTEMSAWLTEEWSLKRYVAYTEFRTAYGPDFTALTPREQWTRLNAYIAVCRKKYGSELEAVRAADRQTVRMSIDKSVPPLSLLAFFLVAATLAGFVPLILTTVFLPPKYIFPSLAALPVFLSASILLLKHITHRSFSDLSLPTKNSRRSFAEFSSDFILDGIENTASAKSDIGQAVTASPRLNVFFVTLEKIDRFLTTVSSVFALGLVLISPVYSALWLLVAFSRELAEAAVKLRAAFIEEDAVFAGLAATAVKAFMLPSRTLIAVIGMFKKKISKFIEIPAQLIAAAALVLITAFAAASPIFYVTAAAFALVIPMTAVAEKYSEKHVKHRRPEISTECKRSIGDNIGVYPRVGFLLGAGYVSAVTDRGDSKDSCGEVPLFDGMKIYLKENGDKTEFGFFPPHVYESGRITLNAKAGKHTFAVEISACDGGKAMVIKSKEKQNFTIICAHLPEKKYAVLDKDFDSELCDMAVLCEKSADTPVYVAVASKRNSDFSVCTDSTEFRYGVNANDGKIVAVTVNATDGSAFVAFGADYDADKLSARMSCIFKDGYLHRARSASETLSRFYKLNSSLYDIASFVLYGKCRYKDSGLGKYIDLKLNTLVCSQRNGGNLARLYNKLKNIAVLKKLGLKFNTAVLCYDEPMRFGVTKNKVNLMFEELSLNKNGNAVCLCCENNRAVCEQLQAAAPNVDSLRFKARVANPAVRCYRRARAEFAAETVICGSDKCGVTDVGDGLYDGTGASAAAENRVVSDSGLGFVIRADGSGYTFDSAFDGITADGSVLDKLPSEFSVFSESGRVWSASPLPLGAKGEVRCRHCSDSTVFESVTNGLYITERLSVSENGHAKIREIALKNTGKTSRKITVLTCVRPALGNACNMTEPSETQNGVSLKNFLTDREIYLETDAENIRRSFGLESILDESGVVCGISDLKNEGETLALILSTEIRVPPSSSRIVRFALSDIADALKTASGEVKHADNASVSVCMHDKRFDVFVTRLQKQARAALLCPCESDVPTAEDYAKSLLCAAAMPPEDNRLFAKTIVDSCRYRFANGDILIRTKEGKGIRLERSSASLFLPIAVARYVDCTDDRDFLFKRVPYVKEGEDGNCRMSERKASVLEHCLQSVNNCVNNGATDCYGIDSELLILSAVNALLPLVRDTETRVNLVETKTTLCEKLNDCETDKFTAQSIAWLVLLGYGRNVSASFLSELSRNADNVTKLLLCAAMLKRADAETAFGLFASLNPMYRGGTVCAVTADDLPRPCFDASAALARIIAVEGFFGCKQKGNCLVFSPNLPKTVEKAEVRYKSDKTEFTVIIDNTGEGSWRISDGKINYNSDSLEISERLSGKTFILKRR